MKCTRSECTQSYRCSTYGIIAATLLSLMAIGIGMSQAVNGQYYDYKTGTYHSANTTIHNVPSINTTNPVQTPKDTEFSRESGVTKEDNVDALAKQKFDNLMTNIEVEKSYRNLLIDKIEELGIKYPLGGGSWESQR